MATSSLKWQAFLVSPIQDAEDAERRREPGGAGRSWAQKEETVSVVVFLLSVGAALGKEAFTSLR